MTPNRQEQFGHYINLQAIVGVVLGSKQEALRKTKNKKIDMGISQNHPKM